MSSEPAKVPSANHPQMRVPSGFDELFFADRPIPPFWRAWNNATTGRYYLIKAEAVWVPRGQVVRPPTASRIVVWILEAKCLKMLVSALGFEPRTY